MTDTIPETFSVAQILKSVENYSLPFVPLPDSVVTVTSRKRRLVRNLVVKDAAKVLKTLLESIQDRAVTEIRHGTVEERRIHLDLFCQCEGTDQKSMVVLERCMVDSAYNDEYMWLQMHGPQPHDEGWLNSEAAWIAQRMEEGFVILDRRKLCDHIYASLDITQTTAVVTEALGKIFRLPHRKEMKTLVRLEDIEQFVVFSVHL